MSVKRVTEYLEGCTAVYRLVYLRIHDLGFNKTHLLTVVGMRALLIAYVIANAFYSRVVYIIILLLGQDKNFKHNWFNLVQLKFYTLQTSIFKKTHALSSLQERSVQL